MPSADSYPRHAARTRRFTLGEPRSYTVCGDGATLLFLRALSGTDPQTGLWALDLASGEERLVVDPREWREEKLTAAEGARRERVRERASGVVSYSTDRAGARAVFAAGGGLHVVDIATGEQQAVDDVVDAFDPHLSPDGRRVAYVHDGELCLLELSQPRARRLVHEAADGVSWGCAEHVAAEEMGRSRGFWWSPDGEALLVARVDESPVQTWWVADPAHPHQTPRAMRYPAAGTANALVTLHHVTLDGVITELVWDTAAFPYLGRVTWTSGHPPLLQVQSRDQRRAAIHIADVSDGSTMVASVDEDPVWVELFAGVPAWCGEDVVRLVDADGARRLVVGDAPVTDADVYVRAVAGTDDDGLVFTASYDDPTQVHVLRWERGGGTRSLTSTPGVHGAYAADGVVVVSSAALDEPGRTHRVITAKGDHVLRSVAETPTLVPDVQMLSVTERRLPSGVVLPSQHSEGRRWPVLVDPYGGPHAQRVLSARGSWLEPQWLADQGFAVLVVDGRGTPGRDPRSEREVHHALDATLEDQVDALLAVAATEPALDLDRVGIRGWSFGGYLAALAVLRRPDVFHAAVAGAPVVDWRLYDTHYTERYLGHPDQTGEVYERNSLLGDAPSLRRPLLLVHGLADDNVVSAHTLLLSQRLTAAGRPHSVLPLTGVTHMASQEDVAENLLLLQVEFLRSALGAA